MSDQHHNIGQMLDEGLLRAGYSVVTILKAGGNGAVLKATQISTGRDVAVKVLPNPPAGDQNLFDPKRAKRFRREIKVASHLNSQNLIPVIDYGVIEDQPYFVMPFIDGLPVDEYCFFQGLSLNERLKLFVKVLRAVERAHQAGVLHRDLKPSNILVDADGEPCILDFGLAKAIDGIRSIKEVGTISNPLNIVGTFPYVSPERILGPSLEDVRGDVYALGVVLFQMITRSMPIEVTGTASDVAKNITSQKPRKLRDSMVPGNWESDINPYEISSDLQAIVSTALEKKIDDRYQSTGAFADDIERHLQGRIVLARSEQRLIMARRVIRRFRVPIAAALIAIAVLTWSIIKVRGERNAARTAMAVALQDLDNTINNIDRELEFVAGGKKLRERILANAEDSIELLATYAAEDPSLESLGLALLERQGDLARSSGDAIKAESYYLRAAARQPHDPTARARLLRKTGNALDDGTEYFRSALAIARSETVTEDELARILIDTSRDDFLNGEHARAGERIDEALALLRTELNDDALLATALEWDGELQVKLGKLARSRRSLERSLKIRGQALKQDPTNLWLKRRHMISSTCLATYIAMSREFDRAIYHAESAIKTGELLHELDHSNPDYRKGLVSAKTRLARIHRQAGQLEQARSACKGSIELAKRFPYDAAVQRQLGFALEESRRILLKLDLPDEALEDAKLALSVRTSLANRRFDDAEYQTEAARSHQSVASCLQELDRHDDAFEHLREAVRINAKLLEKHPTVPDRIDRIAEAEINLAAWHIRRRTQRDDQLATVSLDSAEHALLSLEDPSPNRKRYLRLIEEARSVIAERKYDDPMPAELPRRPLLQARLHPPR